MATLRVCIAEALRALKATAPGDDPTADELIVGLEAAQNVIVDIHDRRGPLWNVDVSAAYVAGEDQRVRIVAGDTVAITLPNSVALFWAHDPYDYGFAGVGATPPAGSTGAADNVQYRAPADGSRVEVVGVTQALYFYRADLNQWLPATGLTVDSELPFNARLNSAFSALLAERLADAVTAAPPSPMLLKRISLARQAMFARVGNSRPHRAGEWL